MTADWVQPAGLFRRNAEAYLRFAALQRLLSRILRFTSLTAEAPRPGTGSGRMVQDLVHRLPGPAQLDARRDLGNP